MSASASPRRRCGWTGSSESGEGMGGFHVPSREQAALCRECGIDPDAVVVILDNDSTLAMLHLKTRNEITITKGEAQRRKEKHGNQ